ncbi:uncharacterized protein LOC144449439 [Glandiceps talaboti]
MLCLTESRWSGTLGNQFVVGTSTRQPNQVVHRTIRSFLTYMDDDHLNGPERYDEECPDTYNLQVANTSTIEDIGTSTLVTPVSKSPVPASPPRVTSTTPPSNKIPCQVCGDTSSGLHFGVYTCEGCKCFYRRSIREGARYMCAKSGNCCITPDTRNSCRYCRFYRCLALGMSPEGIKLGRRPKLEPKQPIVEYQHMYGQEHSMKALKMKLKRTADVKLYQQQWAHPYSVTGWNASRINAEKLSWNNPGMNFPMKTPSDNLPNCSEQNTLQGLNHFLDFETTELGLTDINTVCPQQDNSHVNVDMHVKEEQTTTDCVNAESGLETLLQSPPVSPTLPEVIYGAAQALAFANMYRQEESDVISPDLEYTTLSSPDTGFIS